MADDINAIMQRVGEIERLTSDWANEEDVVWLLEQVRALVNRERGILDSNAKMRARLTAERDAAIANADDQGHLADLGWAEVDKLREEVKRLSRMPDRVFVSDGASSEVFVRAGAKKR